MTRSVERKGYIGMCMEGATARWHASLARKPAGELKTLAHRVAAETPPGSSVLGVAPGPGYFAIELAKIGGYQVTVSTSAGLSNRCTWED